MGFLTHQSHSISITDWFLMITSVVLLVVFVISWVCTLYKRRQLKAYIVYLLSSNVNTWIIIVSTDNFSQKTSYYAEQTDNMYRKTNDNTIHIIAVFDNNFVEIDRPKQYSYQLSCCCMATLSIISTIVVVCPGHRRRSAGLKFRLARLPTAVRLNVDGWLNEWFG